MSTQLPMGDPTLDLPRAHGGAVLLGALRVSPEDFVVEEQLGYAPSGDGEHVWLTVRKRDRNTHEVARTLARLAGVPQVAVGYAGLKDRRAVTTQSFTVQLPGRDAPDWSQIADESLQILDERRHARKIKRGSLRGNRFTITVRGIAGDRGQAEQTLHRIIEHGVPNYFGAQRFGNAGGNLRQADDLFAGRGRRPKRELRGLLLSAARGFLFNHVLAERVADGSWASALPGDVLMLAGSHRQFMYAPDDAGINERLATMDVHPTGPLCGRNSRALQPQHEAARFEEHVLDDWRVWIDGLQRFGLDADRRALRLAVDGLTWQWLDDDGLELCFGLQSGAYATTVLREVLEAAADPPVVR